MRIDLSKTAMKFMEKQTNSQKIRIIKALMKIPLGDIKALKGKTNYFRLRVGSVRIIYTIENDCIIVNKIDFRGDVYK